MRAIQLAEPKHLQLARCQLVAMIGHDSPCERVDNGHIGPGPERFERDPGRFQFKLAAILVANGAARQPDQHADACGRVRHLDSLPDFEGMPQRPECGLSVALCQFDCATGLCRRRAQHLRVDGRGDLFELAAG